MHLYALSIALGGLAIASASSGAVLPNQDADGLNPHRYRYVPANAVCADYDIAVGVDTSELVWAAPKWQGNAKLLDFVDALTGRNSMVEPFRPKPATERAIFGISATFCAPQHRSDRNGDVILATPGIGMARGHWNSAFEPERYNFVEYAISRGYSVFFYDRLGTGESENVSGFLNQNRIQRAILRSLARRVKAGEFTGDLGVPRKLALAGYSFGSFVTHFAVSEEPDLADVLLLTGICYSSSGLDATGLVRSFAPRVASSLDQRWAELDKGYLTWPDIWTQVGLFFKYGGYRPDATQYTERAKNPYAIAELLTIADGVFQIPKFKGAALAIAGEYDYIVCNGNCTGIYQGPAESVFPAARKVSTHLMPNTGHNINFHDNAPEAYRIMIDFLDKWM